MHKNLCNLFYKGFLFTGYLHEKLNRSYKLIDIDSILFDFYSPDKYIPRLTALIADTKSYISSKRVYSFARIYADEFKIKCDFLLKIPKKTLINQIDTLIDNPMTDLDISYSIYHFMRWLSSIDLTIFAEKVFTNYKLTEREKDILKKRANGLSLSNIGSEYGFHGENARKIEAQAIVRFKKFSAISPNYFICLIYAVNGSHDLVRADIEQYFNNDRTQILWYIISKGSLDCKSFFYSKNKDMICFNKNNI